MNQERVSIIIPHFERFGYLTETVDSVVRWGRPGDQLTVVDDGSCASTVKKVENLLSRVPGSFLPQLICHSQNLGGAAARNSAVRGSKNDWLFCLDSDNLLTPNLLNSLVGNAVRNSIDVAVPEYTVFFQTDSRTITHAWKYPTRNVAIDDHFSRSGIVPSASGNYLFSRESWERAQGYPEGLVLDTWGFGLRQVAIGCTMRVVSGTSYLHRYGHASYWVTGDRQEMQREADLLVTEQPALLRRVMSGELRRHFRLGRNGFRPVLQRDIFPTLKKNKLIQGELLSRRELPEWILQQSAELTSEKGSRNSL